MLLGLDTIDGPGQWSSDADAERPMPSADAMAMEMMELMEMDVMAIYGVSTYGGTIVARTGPRTVGCSMPPLELDTGVMTTDRE
jgi:hypothetical protein